MRSLWRVGRRVVPVIAAVLAVTAGPAFGTTTVVDARTFAWGGNFFGQAGTGSGLPQHTSPVGLAGDHRFTQVAAGLSHSLAIAADGTVWAWGDKDPRRYGDGTTTWRNHPLPIDGLAGVTGIAAGDRHVLAIQA